MTTTPRLLMTEEEFLAKYADELPSYEFVNGEVTRKPMTKKTHMMLTDELQGALRDYRKRVGGMSGPEPPSITATRSTASTVCPMSPIGRQARSAAAR